MRRILVALALISVGFTSFAAQKRELFPAPFVLSDRQELPRTQFISYLKRDHAFQGVRDSSAYFVDLNGHWKYRIFEAANRIPEQVGQDGEALEQIVADWDTIAIPLGRSAQDFLNSKADRASVAVLVRRFTIPFELFDKAHFLHIGAVNSAVTVYVNGHQVGFSQADTKNPVEFDVTNYVSEGRNRIVLVVPKVSATSFLEQGQGFGISRDIYLFAQPKIRMRDYLVRTTLDPTRTNGFLETAMLLKTQLLNANPVTVYYDLYDPAGKLVNSASREVEVGLKTEDTVRFTASVPQAMKWSARTPNLYTILYRIQREGRFTEYVTCKVGFRDVQVVGDDLLVNGVRIRINGMNVTVSEREEMSRRDFEALKYSGVNAVRTPCPMPESFYALCDELGFYVCDVANINTSWQVNSRHKGGNATNNPIWKSAYQTRVNHMYERNKNHPSIIMWATGELSSNGYNMYQAYLALKAKDDTRPVAYDGAWMEWNTDLYMPVFGPRANYVEGYVYGMLGLDLADDHRLAGRPYIPSWIALKKGDKLPAQPEGAQGMFLAAGTDPDDVAALFMSMDIDQVDAQRGIYRFSNKSDMAAAEPFTVNYRLTEFDGQKHKEIKSGTVNVSAEPGESVEVMVPGTGTMAEHTLRELTFTVGDFCRKTFTFGK